MTDAVVGVLQEKCLTLEGIGRDRRLPDKTSTERYCGCSWVEQVICSRRCCCPTFMRALVWALCRILRFKWEFGRFECYNPSYINMSLSFSISLISCHLQSGSGCQRMDARRKPSQEDTSSCQITHSRRQVHGTLAFVVFEDEFYNPTVTGES